MIGSWVRRQGFWALDALKGGTVREHLEDIREIMTAVNHSASVPTDSSGAVANARSGDGTGFDAEAGGEVAWGRESEAEADDLALNTVYAKQLTRLKLLLEHARESTPFYADLPLPDMDLPSPDEALLLSKGLYPEFCEKYEEILWQFPVINRFNFKEDYDAFQSRQYLDQPVHRMSTSGSTGAPLTVRQDMNKRKRVLAAIIYFNEIADHLLGDRLLYLRVWNEKYAKPKYAYIKENIIPVDISLLEEAIEETVKALRQDNAIISMLGYGSTYQGLAKVLLDQGVEPGMFALKNLFSTSERMDMGTKEILQKNLGCRVYDRYSNQENGIIAQTGDFSDLFTVNSADYYVELLDLGEDKPAAVGELARIVITDLFNYAMPIIRYDTGDTAIKVEAGLGHQTRFNSIQGRRVDILYDAEGKLLSPATLDSAVWKFGKIKQFQLIQDSAFDYRVKVNGNRDAYPHGDIIGEFRKFLGSDANIALEFVDEIPMAASGKYQYTVSHYQYDERNYLRKYV